MSCHGFKIGAQQIDRIAPAISAFPNVGRRVEAAPIERQVRIDPLLERADAAVKPCKRKRRRYSIVAFDAELKPVGPSRTAHTILVQTGDDAKWPFDGVFQFEHNTVRAYRDIAGAKAAQLRSDIVAELRCAGLLRR